MQQVLGSVPIQKMESKNISMLSNLIDWSSKNHNHKPRLPASESTGYPIWYYKWQKRVKKSLTLCPGIEPKFRAVLL